MPLELPKQVCALDIETQESISERPFEQYSIAVVGTKIYSLQDGSYEADGYRYFLADQFDALGAFLHGFDGLIVGHNILSFDYRVLHPMIPLHGVVERTVDTLAFLHAQRRSSGNRRGSLKLQTLAQANLGVGKTLKGEKIPRLWKQGKHAEVIAYNEQDCTLAQGLWWKLVSERRIRIGSDTIRIDAKDVSSLTGGDPMFTFDTWRQKIERDGYVLFPQRSRQQGRVPATGLDDEEASFYEPETESRYYSLYCDRCDRTYLFEAHMQPGFSDWEVFNCPDCGQEFGEKRADLGKEVIGSLKGNYGAGTYQGIVPDAFTTVVAAHVRATRPKWAMPMLRSQPDLPERPMTERCTLCGRLIEEVAYENPVDGTPICTGCLTACRWLIALK